jgi:hypothetical protein
MNQAVKGKWALVTGASSGIGTEFARQSADRGMNVILVARREERLQRVKAELESTYGVEASVISMDLADLDAARQLYERVTAEGYKVHVLINNAGFGLHGTIEEIPLEKMQTMLQLDVVTVASLTKLFVREMIKRDAGYILQIASIGAYQPSPEYATYSAAKSFVLNYGEALNYELRNTNVSCTVLSPGVTRTEFFEASGQGEDLSLYQRVTMMKSADVARVGLRAMFNRRASVLPGFVNQMMALGSKLLPRRLVTAVAYRLIAH